MPFSKKTTPLHALHLPIQNILFAVNPFHCFFAKSLWAGKKLVEGTNVDWIEKGLGKVAILVYAIFKLRIKRLMKRWKHSGGNVINAGQVNLVSTCCRYQTRHNSVN